MRAPILSVFALVTLGGTSHAQSSKSHKEVALGMPYPGMQAISGPLQHGAPGATAAAVEHADDRLDDAKILEVTHSVNVRDIEQARLAEERAKDPRVKHLAAEMLRQHQELDERRELFLKRRHFSVMPSTTSRKLLEDGHRALTELENKTGAAFDRAYLTTQIDEHKRALDVLDSSLLPRASDVDVKMLLREMRPVLQHHLDQLEALRAQRSE